MKETSNGTKKEQIGKIKNVFLNLEKKCEISGQIRKFRVN